ncbi:aspartate dehydrogenase [Bosea sp. 117]|uniref:aspartate dehydrogenase n=1 Tax=Bosea sp. 117 TaxID=1125973 RepID=UPI00056DA774|nr:aspartate dehydrogenase [Bosea sp. 117]
MTGLPDARPPARHVGLIGFGAIGRDVYARLAADASLRQTVLIRRSTSRQIAAPGAAVVGDVAALVAARPDLVVEAAGQSAVAEFGPAILAAGISLIVASSGALGDAGLMQALAGAAERGGARLIVPSGAIGGLDYLAALHDEPDARVVYTSRKPVAAWAAELAALGQDPAALAAPFTLFEGGAAEAARLYPRNLNAGLTVALAAGAQRTTVRVIADPAVAHNTHEIEVESAFGTAAMRFANLPSAINPKTSALTAPSLVAAVRRFFATVVI